MTSSDVDNLKVNGYENYKLKNSYRLSSFSQHVITEWNHLQWLILNIELFLKQNWKLSYNDKTFSA